MYGINTLPYYTNTSMTPYGYARGGIASLRPGYGIGGKIKKAFKSVTKPIAKVLDKIVPNEIKPFLPYVAAAVPFLLPGTGFFASAMGRALAGAGANAFAQLSQEGAEKYGINPISVGLSGLSGYLSAPGTGGDLASGKIVGNVPTNIQSGISNISGIDDLAQLGYAGTAPVTQGMITAGQGIPATTDLSYLQKAENFARGLGEYGAETFQKGQTAFDKIASGDILDVKLGDVGNIAKAAGPSVLSAAGDQAYMDAQKALDDYNKSQEGLSQLGVANTEARKAAIRRAMGLSGYTPDEIENTLLKFKFASGGRVGYQEGGLMNLRMGGMPMEMDLRKGGFVPLGKRERADDVPARLSKNEFVFTAKAVRNAGGGDVRKGAKRMYQVMNQLEARA